MTDGCAHYKVNLLELKGCPVFRKDYSQLSIWCVDCEYNKMPRQTTLDILSRRVWRKTYPFKPQKGRRYR